MQGRGVNGRDRAASIVDAVFCMDEMRIGVCRGVNLYDNPQVLRQMDSFPDEAVPILPRCAARGGCPDQMWLMPPE